MRGTLGIVAMGCGVILTGCGVYSNRPPTIRYGEEACGHCRMIISDDRFAAAIIARDGEALKFDDIGCLVEHEADRARPGTIYWVRDFTRSGWLNASEARYVHSTIVHSPMGYGLKAFPAQTTQAGPVLQFNELQTIVAASHQTADH